ncbi:hypothetical protein HYT01_03750 [Candidatus Giovannonibacteria bacterium]|nr:hypothetical protein [Candidatus Giovannonibacteria bacterium]
MGQVSKYPIAKNIYERIFEIFLKTLVNIKDPKEAKEFIESFLSPVERIMLAKRLAIAFLLEKGYDYRQIAHVLRVSSPTISAVNLTRQYGTDGYRKAIKKILREEKINEFLENVVEKLLAAPATATKGGALWKYLRDEVKKDREKRRKPF